MKKMKKLLAIVLAVLMLASLSGCGMSDLPILKAVMAFSQLNSFHVEPEGELGVSVNIPDFGMDMDFSLSAEGGIDYCADPLQFSADLRAQYLDENLNLLVFGEDRGGSFVIEYSLDGGATWEETTVGKTQDILSAMPDTSEFGISDILALGKQLGDVFSGFTKAGQEHVNGRAAQRYDGVVSLRALTKSAEAKESFYAGMAEAMDMDAAELAEHLDLSALADLKLSLWLDAADSRLVKVQLDMSDLMHSLFSSGLFDSILAAETGLEGLDLTLDVSAMRLALTFSNFDGVGTISRPTRGAGPLPAEPSAPAVELPAAEAPAAGSDYANGRWTVVVTKPGVFGDDIVVEVVADRNTIYSVTILQNNETPGIGSIAVDELPGKIVAEQRADVDGIAGATRSSNAIRAAVAEALEEIGFVGGAGTAAPSAAAPASRGDDLQVGSTWAGTLTISGYVGPDDLDGSVSDVWGVIGESGGMTYFEIYRAEDSDNPNASPLLSFWAELDGNRILPVIDPAEEDAWLFGIYLGDADESQLIFTLADGVLSASYLYYDAETPELCDMLFELRPEA